MNDTTKLLLGAGLLLLFLNKNRIAAFQPQGNPPYQNFPQVPPAPPQHTPGWQQWVSTILSVYGSVSSLWAPGGPFYKQPVDPGLIGAAAAGAGAGVLNNNAAGAAGSGIFNNLSFPL